MKIITVQFNYRTRPDYRLLLDVFKESVRIYMPEMKFIDGNKTDSSEINKIENAFVYYCTPAPVNKSGRPLNFNYNDFKLKIWVDFLDNVNDNVIFADCDMLMLQSAKHAFDKPFDVAYTARTTTNRIPMNGGIMMARPTEKARAFFRQMYDTNRKMLRDVSFHHQYRVVWAGMNQSAFGFTFTRGRHGAKVYAYKTIEWNAVDCDWHNINGSTVFCHYKSKLRKLVLQNRKPFGCYTKAMHLWYDIKKKREIRIANKKKVRAV